jgi:NADPH2:quinone reductase
MDGGVTGQTVFVAGGAGAVGHYAIQMALQMGAARVITSVSTPAKADLARAAGADEVVLYKDEPLVQRVAELTGGRGVDRLIEVDLGVNAEADVQMLRPGGQCIAYGSSISPMALPFAPLISRNLQLKFFIVYHLSAPERALAHSVLDRLLRRGVLQHNIAERMALADIVSAHELQEQGRLNGNLVLRVD